MEKRIEHLADWVFCPVCGGKTREKVRPDTILVNFPLFCPKCKHETIIHVKMTGEDVFYKASDLILHKFKKLCGRFVSVGLVKVTFPVEELFTIPLHHFDSLGK